MDNTASIRLESFELEIADIMEADLASLHALSLAVGWPHRPQDWTTVLSLGRGIVARDSIGRVLGSAMRFDHDPHFATVGMVITSPRLQAQGAGRTMMEHILEGIGDRRLGLNATRQARQLYTSLGFQREATVYQCQGEAVVPPGPDRSVEGSLVHLPSAPWDEIVALDARGYGALRHRTLDALRPLSAGTALVRDGRVVAYALCRPFGRGHVVGPVVAATDCDAIAVMRPHVESHAGTFLRIDTRQKGGAFAQFVLSCGMTIFDTVTSMSLNGRWTSLHPEAGEPMVYGLATQALS
ncbi:GNAT family N-acetyltransferase [Rhizobium straminoryzae]|uniref:GNAT family N-acetyltransferase n=1 Tax=Rhizobium straminoryzae TaxID=1387186 RepID=A0A549TDY2_9HYPH|nr:GNAT family N-acetyltransferase [Rhizobium straminoryzae]TRL40294.1 GNAT family N-acetyltransferase [Rhizobium straminoryzae]